MDSSGEPPRKVPKVMQEKTNGEGAEVEKDLDSSVFTLNGSEKDAPEDNSSEFGVGNASDDTDKENTNTNVCSGEVVGGSEVGGSSSDTGGDAVDDSESENVDDEEATDNDLDEDLQEWLDMRDGRIPIPDYVADGRTPEEQLEFVEEMIKSYRTADEDSDYELDESESSYNSESSTDSSESLASDDLDLDINMNF